MKKSLTVFGMILFMLLVSLFSGADADVITSLPEDSVCVQDLFDFAGTELTFRNASTITGDLWCRAFSGSRDPGEEIITEYVAALTSGGWNFEVNHVYDRTYKSGDRAYSVSLTYTGTADFPRGTVRQDYDNDYYGDVTIWYLSEGSAFHGQLIAAKGLDVTDLGLRRGGKNVSLEVGQSSSAELVENADGSFSTSDGRLTTVPGQAMILRDGAPYMTEDVSINRNLDRGREEILIQRYYRNEGIAIAFPYAMLETGDSFGMREMGQDMRDNNVNSVDEFLRLIPLSNENYVFGVCHNGDYVWAHPDPKQGLQKLLIRVLLWDESRKLCVFHIAAEFDSEPYELEALAAIRLDDAKSYSGNAERITMHVGETRTFRYDDGVTGAENEQYKWETLEGSSCVELKGVRHRECEISAVWEGQVRIRVTYKYRTTVPDALTDIERVAYKSYEKEYIIDIE